MKEIKIGEEVYAILVESDEKDGTEWFGAQFESLQLSRMNYKAGKEFKVHFHVLNPRTIKRTQEAFIVVRGKIAVDIYDSLSNLIGTLEARAGEAVIVYRGGHGMRVLEDFSGYESKAGQYSYVSEDKEFK